MERIRVKERDGGRGSERSEGSVLESLAESSAVTLALKRGGGRGVGRDGGQGVVIGARMQATGL